MIHAGVLRGAGYALCNDIKEQCHSVWKACQLSYCLLCRGRWNYTLSLYKVTRIDENEFTMKHSTLCSLGFCAENGSRLPSDFLHATV